VFCAVSENTEVISRFGIDDYFVYMALKDHARDTLKGVFKASPLLLDRHTVFMKLGFGLGLCFFGHGAPCDSINIVFDGSMLLPLHQGASIGPASSVACCLGPLRPLENQ
jgi:hypothetical protein